jgi:DNA-binding MarR family transcriptional regulator
MLVLEDFLPYRLSVLSNLVSGALAEAYSRRYRLSVPEWRVMAVLGRFPGLSAAEVAERTAMDKVAVSRAVGRLLESGRVRRETADDDRRRSVLELTAEGQRLYRRITPVILEYEAALLAGLDARERRLLGGLLDRLHERARQLGPPGLE